MSSKLANLSLEEGVLVLNAKKGVLVVMGGLVVVLLRMMGTKPNSSLGVLEADVGTLLVWKLVVFVLGRRVVMNRGPGRPPRGLTFRP